MELCSIIFCIVVIALTIFYLIVDRMSYWKKRGVPYANPKLFYGNFKGVPTTRHLFEPIRELYGQFKGTAPFYGIYYFLRPAALILDFNLIKRILITDFNNFMDRGMYHNEKDDPLSANLFSLDGNRWRQLRSKLSPTFTAGKMKFMFSSVKEIGHRLVQVFGEQVDNSSVIDIKDFLARYSTDVIGTCAFGIDCNSLMDPNAEFRVMGRKIVTDDRHNSMILNFIRSFPKIALKLRLCLIPDHVHKFFMRVVRETVEFREKNGITRNDFMDIMIKMKNNKSTKLEMLTMNELAAQAFVFYIGGFETSSTTIGFALLELAQQHDIQDRLRKEVNEVLTKHNGELSYESMKDMNYMDQVIYETLRKYTNLPVISRQAENDYLVPGTKYIIEKKTLVIIPSDAIHHDPEIYPNPEAFDPERFSPEEIQKRNQVTWMPFGIGPRNCIGYRFGKMQMRIAFAMLLKNFKFDVCQETEIPAQFRFHGRILSSKNGIHLKVERVTS